jgi:hypothetical protein
MRASDERSRDNSASFTSKLSTFRSAIAILPSISVSRLVPRAYSQANTARMYPSWRRRR